jgi:hypothetical protein
MSTSSNERNPVEALAEEFLDRKRLGKQPWEHSTLCRRLYGKARVSQRHELAISRELQTLESFVADCPSGMETQQFHSAGISADAESRS